ncbi:hypothetical protein EIN_054400 [Entamoeba invadens IP1]|uniref:hypothetical protein n=1 Tax=Entamoeba invadens IP1 TaxID=370355 RepID=UPI0002C3E8FC|nr:hypothetical protein EIN_054400 [Entamoeba invadens IP1]ELP93155.1 hypothetical protein EIN_054400 [Entamoeba invadens IP1]|eukprot:XP_004259926.1 hypothetical protein EIN_054400 [Entamoeba invadens IP1]
MFVFLFFVCAFSITCDKLTNAPYTVEEAFECINSVTITADTATKIKTSLKPLLQSYVFKDILLNPPQPSFDNTFFPQMDMDKMLDNLPTDDGQIFYQYIQKVQAIIDNTHDLHLSFRFSSDEKNKYYYDDFYAYLPFVIDIVEGEYIFTKNPSLDSEHLHVEIPLLDDYYGKTISTINGLEPYKFLKDYAEAHTFLKTPHGRFTYAIESMSFVSLRSAPLAEESFKTKYTIVFSDDTTVDTEYKLLYLGATVVGKEKRNRLLRKQNRSLRPITAEDLSTPKLADNIFDYESSDTNIACKIDLEKKMNTIVLKTFYPEDETADFFKVFNTCIQQIDENTNPILVILPMNGGGYADLEANFEKVLAVHADADLIGSVRISKPSEDIMKNEYGEYLGDTNTCEAVYNETDKTVPLGDFYAKPQTTQYGDATHTFSQNTLMHAGIMLEATLTKNPRIPTDVVIMTDGFCYSACSVLAKGMVEKGNAIVVGFEGDPNIEYENSFDAGNSPTPVIEFTSISMPEVKTLQDLGGMLKISYFETFNWNYNYNETIPREFLLNPIDERSNVWRYDRTKLQQFVDSAIKVHDKYQTQCNKKNKRLVKVSVDCDKEINVEHGHGGYVCGDDGLWSKTCQMSYCDIGYKFDRANNNCIEDVCYNKEHKHNNDYLIVVVSVSVSVVVLVALFFLTIAVVGVIISHRQDKKSYSKI